MAKAIPVVVFGKEYPSKRQACIAFGHSTAKVDHRIAKGMTLEQALKSKDRYTGAKKHPAYSHWNAMRSRCLSRSACNKRYKGFVGMCQSWKDDFWSFVEDMGAPPSDEMTIERLDNAKGYSKKNCIWADMAQQARNRKTNVFIECFGERMCLADWSKKTGIPSSLIAYRISRGWDVEKALTIKPKRGRNNVNKG